MTRYEAVSMQKKYRHHWKAVPVNGLLEIAVVSQPSLSIVLQTSYVVSVERMVMNGSTLNSL